MYIYIYIYKAMLSVMSIIHSESDLLKATPHIKFHFQFSSVMSVMCPCYIYWRTAFYCMFNKMAN